MVKNKKNLLYYFPIFDNNYNIYSNYAVLYSDILNKILKKEKSSKKEIDFYNLLYLKSSDNINYYKNFLERFSLEFDDRVMIESKIRNLLYKILLNVKKNKLLKKGMIRKYYCSGCDQIVDYCNIKTEQKEKTVHTVNIHVERRVKSISVKVNRLINILKSEAIGIKGTEFAGEKAILPILGKKIPIYNVDNIERPVLFTKLFKINKQKENDSKQNKKYAALINNYEQKPKKIEKDLISYGVYENKSKMSYKNYKCKICDSVLEKILSESFYINMGELDQEMNIENTNFIFSFNYNEKNENNNDIKNISYYQCQVCGNLKFKKADICEECGNDYIKNTFELNYNILKYLLPYVIEKNIEYLVSYNKEISVFCDVIKMLNNNIKKEITINKKVELKRPNPYTNLEQKKSYNKLKYLGDLERKNLSDIFSIEKSSVIGKFYLKWKKFFPGEILEELKNMKVRTDFYIERLITTNLHSFIKKQNKSIENGCLYSYIENIINAIEEINYFVYPYLKNIKFEDDKLAFKTAKYYFDKMLLFISPLLIQKNKFPGKFPSYREDYYFEEEIEKNNFIKKFILKVKEGENILNLQYDKKIPLWIKSDDNILVEKIFTNKKYLKNYLDLSDIKEYDEKELSTTRLQMNLKDFTIFIPIYDLSNVRNLINKFNSDLDDLNNRIKKQKLRLMDFDFLEKAPERVVKHKQQKLNNYLATKEKIKKYLEKLKDILKEGSDEN